MSKTGIGAILSQCEHPITFYGEKVTGSHLNYSTQCHDIELFVVVRSLQYWQYYFLPKDFVLYSDHEALKYLHGQQVLSAHHVKWINQFQELHFLSIINQVHIIELLMP